MGIGEQFEFEKTGSIEPENKCYHQKTRFEDWPDGGAIEICEICGKSRYHWEQGESSWIMVRDIEDARNELQNFLDEVTKEC